jgi:hypothetical protein
VDVGLHHHRVQGLIDPAPRFEDDREERALTQRGIRRETSPACVDTTRSRPPFRLVTRAGVRSWCPICNAGDLDALTPGGEAP